MRNLFRGKDEFVLSASFIAIHLAVNEDGVRGRLLEK